MWWRHGNTQQAWVQGPETEIISLFTCRKQRAQTFEDTHSLASLCLWNLPNGSTTNLGPSVQTQDISHSASTGDIKDFSFSCPLCLQAMFFFFFAFLKLALHFKHLCLVNNIFQGWWLNYCPHTHTPASCSTTDLNHSFYTGLNCV